VGLRRIAIVLRSAGGAVRGNSASMRFEKVKVELNRIPREIEDHPGDKHELYMSLHEKLNGLRAMGMPAPEDLTRLEHELEREFAGRNNER
jgi:hypothetical protein